MELAWAWQIYAIASPLAVRIQLAAGEALSIEDRVARNHNHVHLSGQVIF